LKHRIRVKKELFKNVQDIKAIINVKTQANEKFSKDAAEDTLPDFFPEAGLLDDNAAYDIGITIENTPVEIVMSIKTTLEEVFEGKKVELE